MKVHDLALRADYEIASKEHEYFFELDVSFPHTLALSKNLFSFDYTIDVLGDCLFPFV